MTNPAGGGADDGTRAPRRRRHMYASSRAFSVKSSHDERCQCAQCAQVNSFSRNPTPSLPS